MKYIKQNQILLEDLIIKLEKMIKQLKSKQIKNLKFINK